MPAYRNRLDRDFNHLAYYQDPYFQGLRERAEDFELLAALGGPELREILKEIDQTGQFGRVCACGRVNFPVKGNVEDNGTWLHALYICLGCGIRIIVGIDLNIASLPTGQNKRQPIA